MIIASHPAWVCGLKHQKAETKEKGGVTPCVGVWIETSVFNNKLTLRKVTPCVGVWIETFGIRWNWS